MYAAVCDITPDEGVEVLNVFWQRYRDEHEDGWGYSHMYYDAIDHDRAKEVADCFQSYANEIKT